MSLLRGLRAPKRAGTLKEIFAGRNRIHKWHHYFDIYERYLAPLRGEPIRLLEIGVFKGGSLRMWREYFGPRATIMGADIEPSVAEFEREGFRIFVGDQADTAFLEKVRDEIGTVDVIIDDGGHTMLQQVNAFEVLYPAASRLYLVEDTHTSYWPRFQDRPAGTFIDYAKQKVDLLHEWHWKEESFVLHNVRPEERREAPEVSTFCATTRAVHFYDSLVVFEKGQNEPRWHEFR